ncbi:respiratory chain complex I subunit 1 family protein [Methylacidiphilum caldifontis]|uniref:Formate hydrogenlyase n=1 Tax=Methylacidiphilum caldifontis TaxID=2795386 RepID=A0A4Y8PBF1_9BACT|nr:NADH-quinone oxidoreductase subunit H [Methylacidiphilum caldifontis]TFE66974.1 formate hydrogenlyase [Methylacidiphilum caldifontis]
MKNFFYQIIHIALVILIAPLIVGIASKTRSRLLMKKGPSLFQPYRDLLKLFRKESTLPENASWLFKAVPYGVFSLSLVAISLVPTFSSDLLFGRAADLITIIALLGTARFLLSLAALDPGTSFGGLGSSRESFISSLAEPAMIMIIFTLSLLARSTDLSAISHFMMSGQVGLRVSLWLALASLVLVAIAENGRIPIDNPSTHLELTMVHEAMILEYSAKYLALLEAASQLKLLLYLSLIITVFFPFGMTSPGKGIASLLMALCIYLAKIGAAALILAFFETLVAKMRLFKIPSFLGAAFMIALLATILLFVSRSL